MLPRLGRVSDVVTDKGALENWAHECAPQTFPHNKFNAHLFVYTHSTMVLLGRNPDAMTDKCSVERSLGGMLLCCANVGAHFQASHIAYLVHTSLYTSIVKCLFWEDLCAVVFTDTHRHRFIHCLCQ